MDQLHIICEGLHSTQPHVVQAPRRCVPWWLLRQVVAATVKAPAAGAAALKAAAAPAPLGSIPLTLHASHNGTTCARTAGCTKADNHPGAMPLPGDPIEPSCYILQEAINAWPDMFLAGCRLQALRQSSAVCGVQGIAVTAVGCQHGVVR